MKKITAFAMTIAMVLGMMPAPVWATEVETEIVETEVSAEMAEADEDEVDAEMAEADEDAVDAEMAEADADVAEADIEVMEPGTDEVDPEIEPMAYFICPWVNLAFDDLHYGDYPPTTIDAELYDSQSYPENACKVQAKVTWYRVQSPRPVVVDTSEPFGEGEYYARINLTAPSGWAFSTVYVKATSTYDNRNDERLIPGNPGADETGESLSMTTRHFNFKVADKELAITLKMPEDGQDYPTTVKAILSGEDMTDEGLFSDTEVIWVNPIDASDYWWNPHEIEKTSAGVAQTAEWCDDEGAILHLKLYYDATLQNSIALGQYSKNVKVYFYVSEGYDYIFDSANCLDAFIPRVMEDAKGRYLSVAVQVPMNMRAPAGEITLSAAKTDTGVKLTWNKATKELDHPIRYEIYRYPTNNEDYDWHEKGEWIGTVTDKASFIDKTAKKNFIYHYQVVARYGFYAFIDEDGYGEDLYLGLPIYSNYAKVSLMENPKAPKCKNVRGGVELTWSKSSNAKAYKVYRKTGSSGSWTNIANCASTLTTYTDNTAKSGKTYYYSIRVVNKYGDASSYNKTGTSIKYVAAPVITKTAKVTTGVKLTWGKVAGAVNYRVRRKYGSTWTTLGTTTGTTYTDKTAKKGKIYYYTVICVTKDGKTAVSGYSASKKVTR